MNDRRKLKPRRKWTVQMNADLLSCKWEAVAMTLLEQPPLDGNGRKNGYIRIMNELWDAKGYVAWESGLPLSLFRFHLSPFPQKRLILRLKDMEISDSQARTYVIKQLDLRKTLEEGSENLSWEARMQI